MTKKKESRKATALQERLGILRFQAFNEGYEQGLKAEEDKRKKSEACLPSRQREADLQLAEALARVADAIAHFVTERRS